MKRVLYGVVGALAGTALALPASAEDMMMEGVSISGYMNHDMGFGSYIGGGPAVDDYHQEIDAELTFTATTETDGGLKITAAMQIDADSGAGVDESSLTIAGGFGSIIVGAEDNAANRLGNKGIGGGYGGGGYYDCGETWQPARCGGPVGSSDHLGLQYTTPIINGFQAGVSFQPDSTGEGATDANNDSTVVAVGANFSAEAAGVGLTFGANWKTQEALVGGDGDNADMTTGKSMEDWGVGAAFAVGATTLSVRYDIHAPAGNAEDTTDYGVGVDHTIGAIKFGAGYGQSQKPGADHSVVSAGATYTLGGGVSVTGAINAGQIDAPGDDDDMDDVGVGLRIAFSF